MPNLNTLFAIFGVSNIPALEAQLQNIAPWLSLKVQDGQWLVIAPNATTSKEVADRLGITTNDPVSSAVVLRVETYSGRTAASTWEWIATKLGANLVTVAPVA